MILATSDMATLLGITERRVNQLAVDGLLVRTEAGRFDAPASMKAYIEHVSGKGRDKDEALNTERESARLKKEQADWQELKNAKERRELIPAYEAESAWSEQIGRLRSGMLAVTSRVRQRISMSVEDAVILDREIRDAMMVLSEVAFSDDEVTSRDSVGASEAGAAAEDQPA